MRVGRRLGRERGSVSLEIAVLGPALLLLVFTIVQASMWFYARSLALAAAEEGVAAGRAYGNPPAAGVQAASAWLERNAGDSLLNSDVALIEAGPSRVAIEVRGQALSVLPGIAGVPVRQVAYGPVERFTTAGTP